ncbi:hypothetical protein DNTS_026870 [Danionella cerebrum]|uniref:Uncharacterized protein n=1 Tax=Danionella cerebrum TaxID=2873325 RepID=A0A553QE06_9TELE|nr:hypothetical protein DNTS_026870 [Danionella translucida]
MKVSPDSRQENECDRTSERFSKPTLSSTVTTGKAQVCFVTDDLCLEERKIFIGKWSNELRNLRSKTHKKKIFKVEKFRKSLESLHFREIQTQKETEIQKDFQWFVQILKSLPKSSVCQEGGSKTELLNLYKRWKKGELVSILPIMNFIMKTILQEIM